MGPPSVERNVYALKRRRITMSVFVTLHKEILGLYNVLWSPVIFYKFWQTFEGLQDLDLKLKLYKTYSAFVALSDQA